MKLRRLDDEGSLGFFLAMIFVGIVFIFLFAIASPMMTAFNSAMYVAGDNIMNQSTGILQGIHNVTLRNQIIGTVQDAQSATSDSITYLSFFYKYGWILVIVITAFVLFMLGLKTVELNKSGFGGIA